jgi:hypothetical protein
MKIISNRILTILLVALLGGVLAACAVRLTPSQEQGELQAARGQQSWPSIDKLLATIPPEELKQPVEEHFILIGPGDQVIRIPRPPMDKETALRLWWEASRRAWERITQRFRNTLTEGQDHSLLNDPYFKIRMQEENQRILAEELRKVIAKWQRTQSQHQQP